MRRCKLTFSFLLISSLILSSLSFLPIAIATYSDLEGENGNEPEFTYIESTGKGPSNWGKLNPDWTACGSGKLQSPIDVTRGQAVKINDLGILEISYKPATAVLKNRGHDIMVTWENQDAGKVNIDGTDYKLIQCHWHSPSEHMFDGSKFDLEIHIVHSSDNGQIAVIAMVYKFGNSDPFLSKLLSQIRESAGEGEEGGRELGPVNPGDLDIDFSSEGYYRYIGSLTTPPCTEGVVWTILNKVKTVSREEVETLRNAVDDRFESNARPTQNLNGRSISFYSNQ